MHQSAATTYDDTTLLHPFNDEASVVAAARNGDSGAFNVLAATYRKKIVNIARNITGNLDDAEDVAQQALMKAFVNIRGFRGTSSFSSWLTRIAINESLILKRRPFRRAEVSCRNSLEELGIVPDIKDGRPNPEQLYEKQERRQLMLGAIKELKPKARFILETCDLNECSVNALALIQGISSGAAKARLARSRNILRAKFARALRSRATEGVRPAGIRA